MSRVVQAFIDSSDMVIDDNNAFVIWIEIPDEARLVAIHSAYTITDTDIEAGAPGVDLKVTT